MANWPYCSFCNRPPSTSATQQTVASNTCTEAPEESTAPNSTALLFLTNRSSHSHRSNKFYEIHMFQLQTPTANFSDGNKRSLHWSKAEAATAVQLRPSFCRWSTCKTRQGRQWQKQKIRAVTCVHATKVRTVRSFQRQTPQNMPKQKGTMKTRNRERRNIYTGGVDRFFP